MSDETGGHLEAIMSDILMWGGGNSCCRTNILKLLGSISLIQFADVSNRKKNIYLSIYYFSLTKAAFNRVWVASSLTVREGKIKGSVSKWNHANGLTTMKERCSGRNRKRLLLNMRGAANEIKGRCSNMCLPLSRDSLSHSKTQFLFFLAFFLRPMQSESDVSHHLACLQRERVAGARRPTLGASRVMLLPLWQSHIPPAARQLTGSHKSPQIGPKKATKAIFSRHKATGIK